MSPLWIVLALLPILGGAERFNCRNRILGAYYADAKSGCKAFHVCVRVAGGGIRDFRFFCPPGTLFHQEAQTCTDWGDDDPLACPADLYDGQFDLYKIGSGYDTKKLSSPDAREDEAEFGLQRAETGDRRLAQNNGNAPASDLRAAHSSDFFSGQRERGRDESQNNPSTPAPSAPSAPARTSFRRPTSPRTTSTTQFTNPPPPPPPKPSHNNQYDTKRKLVRKRPIYVSTQAPSTFAQSSPRQQFPEYQQPTNFERRVPQQSRPSPTTEPASIPPQYKDEYVEVSRVTPKQNRYFSNSPSPAPFSQPTTLNPYFLKKETKGLVELYNYNSQSTPGINVQNDNKPFKVRNSFSVATDIPQEQNFVRSNVNNDNGRGTPTTIDYNTAANRGFSTTPAYRNFNSVSYEPEKNNFVQHSNAKNFYNSPSTTPTTTTFYTTTRADPSYNLNTVAYNTNIGFNAQPSKYANSEEDDGQYRPPAGEDDGQYRPELYEKERERERDRELLSGAHSLNIAASGNRLPEDQEQKGKTKKPSKPVSHTAAPRPFRPAQTPSTTAAPPPSTYEPFFTTTYRPQTVSTQRTFDYFQTYTTTVRPSDPPIPVHVPTTNNYENVPVRTTTRAPAPPAPTSRPTTWPTPQPTTRPAPQPTTRPTPQPTTRPTPQPTTRPAPQPLPPSSRPPHFANPANAKEDTSYDYAYYDSDPGFSEYDHIEEFGKTKTKV